MAHSAVVSKQVGSFEDYAPEVAKLGVCIFFLISGFLLYRPFVAARWRGTQSPAVRDFARRRLLRIVPAYWFALAVVVVFFEVGVTPDNWWIFPAFGQIYQQKTFDLGISPAWTLCVEMTFYALLPIYALLVARLSPKKVSVWADAVPLVVLASASLAFHAVYLDKSNHKIASTLPGTFYWFALGMGLAVASVWAAHGGDRAPLGSLRARAPCAWLRRWLRSWCFVRWSRLPGSTAAILPSMSP